MFVKKGKKNLNLNFPHKYVLWKFQSLLIFSYRTALTLRILHTEQYFFILWIMLFKFIFKAHKLRMKKKNAKGIK